MNHPHPFIKSMVLLSAILISISSYGQSARPSPSPRPDIKLDPDVKIDIGQINVDLGRGFPFNTPPEILPPVSAAAERPSEEFTSALRRIVAAVEGDFASIRGASRTEHTWNSEVNLPGMECTIYNLQARQLYQLICSRGERDRVEYDRLINFARLSFPDWTAYRYNTALSMGVPSVFLSRELRPRNQPIIQVTSPAVAGLVSVQLQVYKTGR